MFCKPLCTVGFVFLTLGLCPAQEAIKAEPSHYKLAFENEYVQVVNVHYGPHEKSSMHAHMGGVVVNITAGHMRMTDEHGKVREVRSLPGEARWFPPFKHSVENLEGASTNSVYVGIKHYHSDSAHKDGAPVMDSKTKALVAQALAMAMAAPQKR
jgi:quercetin dioxygenase-like cupin family protein